MQQNLYKNLRDEFILIGLTSSVGSGSTTTAKNLAQSYQSFEIENILGCELKNTIDDLEKRRIKRVKEYYSQNSWEKFYHLKVSNILFAMVFATKNTEECKELLLNRWYRDSDLSKAIALSKEIVEAINKYKYVKAEDFDILKKLDDLDKLIQDKVTKNDISYTQTFQAIGESLRENGTIHKSLSKVFDYKELPNVFYVAETLRRVGKLLYAQDEKLIVVDALRNTYEIQYFKNRYANFYLLSVVASESTRKTRTNIQFGLKENDYEKIKEFEYSDKETSSQNINSCIGLGDVFINNDSSCSDKYLQYQIFKYIALIRKPGLFTPNDDERNMQVALTARYNAGCISRQVGACVTGSDGYVRGIGWNDVQEGNTPCLYRTLDELLQPTPSEAYSEYEKSEFSEYVKQQKLNRNVPFCFKDIQNQKEITTKLAKLKFDIEDKEKIIKLFKNPTRERALHAEENAFLQLAKTGGQSVVGGTLYTTDSPCQLCAKKAMQLKIKRIVYIDAYPDISTTHTLKSGRKDEYPEFDMFEGVSGSAYFRLFRPIVGIKEELKGI
ncbi:MAG: deaminase [Sulfurimonas sp.]|nr:deaminase [Sulfurimonas sp.]